MNDSIKSKKKNMWNGYSKKSRIERIELLKKNNLINDKFFYILLENKTLSCDTAEQMSENILGTFSLPFGIAPYFLVDGKDYAIPMVTEEPSVIAACSYAGKIIAKSGGFSTKIHSRKMIGQVILYNIPDLKKATENITKNKKEIIETANRAYPSIGLRGGGAENLKIRSFSEKSDTFLAVYLIVDVKEAMGANIMNTMLESIKSILENITQGNVLMAILSNYATESLVSSTCEIDLRYLSNDLEAAADIAKKIELASNFAKLDVYRASTHNKGILNGIDAVTIATGNDWRAIEAGAHSYASRDGSYKGLTTWKFDKISKKLRGSLTLPMPIASVGGSIGLNPTVKAVFHILGNPDAKTLSKIIVSVGLAQNLAALKALVTTGIQRGHMKLQARSLALSAGALNHEVNSLVEKLLLEKYINLATAKMLLSKMREKLNIII